LSTNCGLYISGKVRTELSGYSLIDVVTVDDAECSASGDARDSSDEDVPDAVSD